MRTRVLAKAVAVFGAIGALVAGRALGRRLAAARPEVRMGREEPGDEQTIEDAVEIDRP